MKRFVSSCRSPMALMCQCRSLTKGNFSTAQGDRSPGGGTNQGQSPGAHPGQGRGPRVSNRVPKDFDEQRSKYYHDIAAEDATAGTFSDEQNPNVKRTDIPETLDETEDKTSEYYKKSLRLEELDRKDGRTADLKDVRYMAKRSPTDSPAERNVDQDERVTGDSYGLYETRTAFYAPMPRNVNQASDELKKLFPPNCPPERCIAPQNVRQLATRFGVPMGHVVHALLEAKHDINIGLEFLQQYRKDLNEEENQRRKAKGMEPIQHGSMPADYGLVALEAYDPETFCFVNFVLPSFESTRDYATLEAIHELTLSAAELPVDIPKDRLVDRFVTSWTTEEGTPVKQILQEHNLSVKEIVMLPYGEYSVQGLYVFNPVHDDFPNIGTGASACCLDLRSGIHNRFRFHAERIADSISEHVAKEAYHFDQDAHILRQPFWFKPEYSVEDYIRLKENLMSPSLGVFEMRYAVMHHGSASRPYRNIVECEELRIMQHKMEKTYKEIATGGQAMNVWTGMSDVQSSACTAPVGGFHGSGNKEDSLNTYDDITSPERDNMERAGLTTPHERIWQRFYRRNTY